MKKRTINLIIGPLLLIICCNILPDYYFDTLSSKVAIGTLLWMAYWWITSPVDYAVTGFLPIIINALFSITNMEKVISNYSSETIILVFAASVITSSWEITGLDRRIAITCLHYIGENFRKQLIFWFLLSMVLSSVLPNSIVCAVIVPIAVAMLKYIDEGDIENSKNGSKLLLYIVYAIGLGGLASPLGGAMNLVIIDYLQQITGTEFYYSSWVLHFLPIMFFLVIVNILFMIRNVKKEETLGGSKEFFLNEYNKLSKISKEEQMSFILFLIPTILSFFRSLFQTIMPNLKPAYIFVACAILTFIITDKNKNRIISWKVIQNKIVWGLLFVFAGGLALGTIMSESGATMAIGEVANSFGASSVLSILILIAVSTMLMANTTSNTAAASVVTPIVISIMNNTALNPIPFVFVVAIGINLAYILPTSIRAIPVGYGLQPKYMLKEGIKLTVILMILVVVLSYILIKFWNYFSII